MEMTQYAPGTPSWVDVGLEDLPKTAAFYCDLFGWTAHDQGPEAGHYTMFEYKGHSVAAAGPKMNPGPPTWATYITVAEADATVEAIKANGGSIVVDAMDVMDVGRMAVAADPSGGIFSIWEPRSHIGAGLVNEPNTLCWNELTVRDADKIVEFYSQVFGWSVVTHEGDFVYRELQVDGRSVAGCVEMDSNWPDEIPTHWMAYFAVDDCDAMAARVTELGGTVSVPPFDLPVGRTAVVNDPEGTVFSIIKLADDGQ